MEASSLPKSPLLSKPPSLSKPQCSLGVSFPKIPIRPFSFCLSSTRLTLHSNPLSNQFASLSFSATALSATSGGGGDELAGGGGGGGGGGDGASGGGGAEAKSIALEEALSQSSDVIVLYVGVI